MNNISVMSSTLLPSAQLLLPQGWEARLSADDAVVTADCKGSAFVAWYPLNEACVKELMRGRWWLNGVLPGCKRAKLKLTEEQQQQWTLVLHFWSTQVRLVAARDESRLCDVDMGTGALVLRAGHAGIADGAPPALAATDIA
jgi:hypothetical protein